MKFLFNNWLLIVLGVVAYKWYSKKGNKEKADEILKGVTSGTPWISPESFLDEPRKGELNVISTRIYESMKGA